MVYLRKEVVDALYDAGVNSDDWQDYVNEAILEAIASKKNK